MVLKQRKMVIGLPKDDHGEKERCIHEYEAVVSCSWIPNLVDLILMVSCSWTPLSACA